MAEALGSLSSENVTALFSSLIAYMEDSNFKNNLLHTLLLGKPALCFLSSDDTHSSGIMAEHKK